MSKDSVFSRLLGLGIKAMANDEETSPEELAAATGELHEKMQDKGSKYDGPSCVPGVKGHEDCSEGNCMFKDAKPRDFEAPAPEEEQLEETGTTEMDERQKHHDMLDRILDKMRHKKKDSDVEELKTLLNEYLGEEEQEPEHQMDAKDKKEKDSGDNPDNATGEPIVAKDGEEGEIVEPEEDAEEEEKMAKATSNDAAMALLTVVEKSKVNGIKQAFDSALESTLDDEEAFLKKFRSSVAKSKDSILISAFNGEHRRVHGTTKTSDSSYSKFGMASKLRSKDTEKQPKFPYQELENAYSKILNGEVK